MTSQTSLLEYLSDSEKKHVAIMEDIEAVLPGEEHKCVLQLQWWEDSDINKSVEDHEMCVHVFGVS